MGLRSLLTPNTSTVVFVYTDAGRTSLATVYTSADPAVTTARTQPLPPDSEGNVALYLAPGRTYYWATGDGQTGEFFAPVPDGAAWVGAFEGATATARVQAAFDSGAAEVVFEDGLDVTILDTTIPITVKTITAYGATVRHESKAGNGFGMFSKLLADGWDTFHVRGGAFHGVGGDDLAVADSCFYLDTTAQTIGTTERFTFHHTSFTDFQGYPIRAPYTHTLHIDSCRFEDCSIGPNFYTPRAAWVTNCEFNGNPYTGVGVAPSLAFNAYPEPTDDTSDDQVREVHITGNTFRNLELHQSLLLHGAYFGDISGNLFDRCNAPISLHTNGVVGSYMAHRYLTITRNTMLGTDDYGDADTGDLHTHGGTVAYFNPAIEVSGDVLSEAKNIHIAGNIIVHYGAAAEAANPGDSVFVGAIMSNGYTRNMEIRDNFISDSWGAGIRLSGQHLNVRIRGNSIVDVHDPNGQLGAGIRLLDAAATGAVISGLLDGNWFRTMTIGLAATQTTPDFSGLRVTGDNTFQAVTTPHSISTAANRPHLPQRTATVSPVTIDASVEEFVSVEMNGDVDVAAPTNPRGGKTLQVQVYNPGSLGTITWNAVFKLQDTFANPVAGAFTQVTFVYDSTRSRWNEVGRTTNDYA